LLAPSSRLAPLLDEANAVLSDRSEPKKPRRLGRGLSKEDGG
jgi:hypothetical protein